MAVTFNGITRQIIVDDPADASLDVQDDIYSRWKDWSLLGDNAKYAPALRAFGGDPTAAGQTAPIYFFLQNLWTVYVNNGVVIEVGLNLYSDDFASPYVVEAGSGVVGRNSDAVNVNEIDIQNQSFLGGFVYINTDGLGEAGTIYPIGTPSRPSSNYPDAFIIATTRKLNNYHLDGTLSITTFDDISNTNWEGNSPIKSALVLTGEDATMSTFTRIGITGSFASTGRSSFKECTLGGPLNLTGFSAIAQDCGLNGDIQLDPTITGIVYFGNCTSVIAGTAKPVVDCNNTAEGIQFRNFRGGLKIINFTGGGDMSIDIDGRLELDATCTAGTIVVGGMVELIDNSGAGCNVIIESTHQGLNQPIKRNTDLIPGTL